MKGNKDNCDSFNPPKNIVFFPKGGFVIPRNTETKEKKNGGELESVFGANYMIQFRDDTRKIVLGKKENLSKIKTKRKEREDNIENAPEKAKSLFSKLNWIIMFSIWGITLILTYKKVPLIEQHLNLVALINTIPVIYAIEFSMRKFMIDTFSYKEVPTDENNLKFMDAWNRQLRKPSFLASCWFMAMVLRWFPKYYKHAMGYLSRLFFETDSLTELLTSAFKRERGVT